MNSVLSRGLAQAAVVAPRTGMAALPRPDARPRAGAMLTLSGVAERFAAAYFGREREEDDDA